MGHNYLQSLSVSPKHGAISSGVQHLKTNVLARCQGVGLWAQELKTKMWI